MDELKYHLALFHAPGIGHKLFHAIAEFLALKQISLADIFQTPRLFEQLIKAEKAQSTQQTNTLHLLTEKTQQRFCHYLQQEAFQSQTLNQQIDQELAWQAQAHCHIILSSDSHYPELLKQIDSPPPLLFVMGDPNLLNKVQLAVVGSRTPTPSGHETAFQFAHYLAQAGMVITSGMALGIDTAAHQGSIAAKGKTIAVAGTGLDRIYPAKNRELAHQIAEQGALVSCFALGSGPTRGNFPRRNQIISGLSVGTLVVEAALQSGSLITARLAMEQGREVFAIPGSIHNPLARGCHALIRQGAKLVETAEDIAEEIINLSIASQMVEEPDTGIEKAAQSISNSPIQPRNSHLSKPDKSIPAGESSSLLPIDPKLPNEQQQLLSYLDAEPVSLDQLADRSQIHMDQIVSMIVLLELEGYIESLPGGKICRC